MFYLEQLGQPGFHEPYWRFWLRFLNVPALASGLAVRGSWTSGGVQYDPAHLWFLYCLLVFSLALLPLFVFLRRPKGALILDRAAAFTEHHPAIALSAAAIPLALVEAAVGPDGNTGGWERTAYLFPLLYGYLIASDRRFEAALRRARRAAFAWAIVATLALVVWAGSLGASGTDVMTGTTPGWGALQGLAGWAWIVAILGFAGSLASRRRSPSPIAVASPSERRETPWPRLGRYANEAVLPFYVLHEPVIAAAALLIVRWSAPTFGKYVVLVILSLSGTLILYEVLVRRFMITRVLFGMKPSAQSQA
jgi:hypothetical protein